MNSKVLWQLWLGEKKLQQIVAAICNETFVMTVKIVCRTHTCKCHYFSHQAWLAFWMLSRQCVFVSLSLWFCIQIGTHIQFCIKSFVKDVIFKKDANARNFERKCEFVTCWILMFFFQQDLGWISSEKGHTFYKLSDLISILDRMSW